MKRLLLLLLCLLFALGCSAPEGAYRHARFALVLPEGWERVREDGAVCFAPNGDPVRNSNIVFYATDKNYYFQTFDESDYMAYVSAYDTYEDIEVSDFETLRLDGWDAHRVTFFAVADQAQIQIILYAVDADMTYFFVLFEMEGDEVAASFDAAMQNVKIYPAD
ncbi:MAG: hypothetical protein Q4C04_00805 [Clostridia bacterium]|nr:hypothetical protein [Clostridia bacterium]